MTYRIVLASLLALGVVYDTHSAVVVAAKTDVFVVGTLYRRHETVPTYDLDALKRVITAIAPDVLVLDCTPQEIRDRTVHASKIEYAQVIFPLVQAGHYKVYPAEPDEPMFSEIVKATAAAHQTFQQTKVEDFGAFQEYVKTTYAVLARHWRSPAEVNDDLTGRVLGAKKALEGQLVGDVAASGSDRWNQHWTDSILRAVAENPGKRVLALTGIENRYWIVDALRRSAEVQLIDMPTWLRAHTP